MAVEINEKLGMQISTATRPQATYPDDLKTMTYVDVSNGVALMLNGVTYDYVKILPAAQAALIPALSNVEGGIEDFDNKLGELFDKASKAIELVPRDKWLIGGVNATAIKVSRSPEGVFVAAYAHVGNNRIYSVGERTVGIQMETIDGGYHYEKNLRITYGEDSKEIARLINMIEAREDLEALKKVDYRVDNYWNNMMKSPVESLGDPKLAGFHIGRIVPVVGDSLLISSLGVHRSLSQREIFEIVTKEFDPAQVLVDAAHTRSSTKHFRAAPSQDYAAIVIERLA